MRQQEPVEHGTTDIQLCYSVQLRDEEEVERVKLDPAEYIDGMWKTYDEILLEGGGKRYHPALKYAVRCFLASMSLEKMAECEDRMRKKEEENGGGISSSSSSNGDDDAELAKWTREFLKRRRDADEMLLKEQGDYALDSKELNYRAAVRSRF